jgi:hypothetical protein
MSQLMSQLMKAAANAPSTGHLDEPTTFSRQLWGLDEDRQM